VDKSARIGEGCQVKRIQLAAACIIMGAAVPAIAGPPYLNDDPVPTGKGQWEIYAFTAGEGRGSNLDQDVGLDLNYGAVTGVQLTATLPLSFTHGKTQGWRGGTGDVELGIKYRFLEDKKAGFSAAIFPRAILPTASNSRGEKTRFLLPLWLERDFKGGTSLFGGGGYEINPGPGNRDFWLGGITVTKDLGEALSLGTEISWQGSDTIGGTNQTRAGIGSIVKLSEHGNLLVSGGPTWADHRTGYHFYAALGLNF
jgi:hypothetical protein